MSFASYLIRVRTDENKLLPQFAADFLSTQIGRLQIDRSSRQIIGMTNINAEEIRELRIPLPSVDEQRRLIAAMDGARSRRKSKQDQASDLLGGLDSFLAKALGLAEPPNDHRRVFAITRASARFRFDPHFHAPEFERIQAILKNTHCASLGSFTSFSDETWRPESHNEATFRYIEISMVSPATGEAKWTETPTAEAPSRARMAVRPDDIIVNLTRPHHGSIAHLTEEFAGCVASTGFAVIRSVAPHVRRDYLWCVLRSRFCLKQMLQRASGGNYPAITEAELGNITVPVPDLATQTSVAAEATRRRIEAGRLRMEAEAEWSMAKLRLQAQLLGAE
jgi:hypothetical protein